jgi:hypothetical protein
MLMTEKANKFSPFLLAGVLMTYVCVIASRSPPRSRSCNKVMMIRVDLKSIMAFLIFWYLLCIVFPDSRVLLRNQNWSLLFEWTPIPQMLPLFAKRVSLLCTELSRRLNVVKILKGTNQIIMLELTNHNIWLAQVILVDVYSDRNHSISVTLVNYRHWSAWDHRLRMKTFMRTEIFVLTNYT